MQSVPALAGRYAKFLTAAAGNALLFADITWGATNRWVELATAAAVALGVAAVPNTPKPSLPVLTMPPVTPVTPVTPMTPPGGTT